MVVPLHFLHSLHWSLGSSATNLFILLFVVQMSGEASFHHSTAREVQDPIEILDSSSSPIGAQTHARVHLPSVSTRTRSKVKVINPEQAHIIPKTLLFSHKTRDTKPVSLNPSSPDDAKSGSTLHASSSYHTDSLSADSPLATDVETNPVDQKEHSDESTESIPLRNPTIDLACASLDSSVSVSQLEHLNQFYHTGCTLIIPTKNERCHRFDNFEPDQMIPNAVLSAQFFKLGLSLPLHPFIQDILRFYDIAPFQLIINSYRMAMCLYILYNREFDNNLSAFELSYFY